MQGFNMGRYYPPSTDTAPTFNTSHPLGQRARKISDGILTVRFEMPFAIWCTTCTPPTLIGQGVRFNAEKKKVGNYHSTPIWQFRMKHTACGGWIAIRTDPKAAEYLVESGANRRDTGNHGAYDVDGESESGLGGVDMEIMTSEERERRRNDAFASFEGKKAQVQQKRAEEDRIEGLKALREKDWADPYAANKRLRKPFREGRKERTKQEGVREELQARFGLGLDIVDEREEDRQRAKLIEFGGVADGDGEDGVLRKAAAKPLFAESVAGCLLASHAVGKSAAETRKDVAVRAMTKAARAAERSKKLLQQELRGNTRAAMDPFLSEKTQMTSRSITGIKRKRAVADDGENDGSGKDDRSSAKAEIPCQHSEPPLQKKSLTLVDYDSDE